MPATSRRRMLLSRSGGLRTSPGTLTLSGNEITDAVRNTGTEGDGETPPAGMGIWPAATNLVTNGGFETNTTGWNNSGVFEIEPSTEQAKFGSASLKSTANTTNTGGNLSPANYNFSVGSAGTYSFSVWVYVPSSWTGATIRAAADGFTGATGTLIVNADMNVRDAWQRIEVPNVTIDAGDLLGALRVSADTGGIVDTEFIYTDGAQVESGAVCTPYIEADGGTASRSAARVQLPVANLFTETQGWVAMRLDSDGSAPMLFEWGDDLNNRLLAYYDSTPGWHMYRIGGGSGGAQTTVTGAPGAPQTIVSAWEATRVRTSVDGGAISSTNQSTIPTLTETDADIGTSPVTSSSLFLNGRALWVATGSGTLTDADAARLNDYGDVAPSLRTLRSSLNGAAKPTAAWNAITSRFEKVA